MSTDQDPKAEEAQDQSPKLPERDFFSGDSMFKFAEELGVFGPPPKKDQPKPEVKPAPSAEDDCPGCPGGKKAASTPPPAEAPKPFRVIKVDGKDVPVRDEAHLIELAQKGADYTQKRQRDAEWEKSLLERENKLEEMRPILEKVQAGMELKATEKRKLEDEGVDTTNLRPEEDEPLDPVAAAKIKKMELELADLKKDRERRQETETEKKTADLGTYLHTKFDEAKKSHGFTDILDPETGEDRTRDTFAFIMAGRITTDVERQKRDRSFQLKTLDAYVADTAAELARIQGAKGNGGGNADATQPKTAADFAKANPTLAEEIRQQAVADYLRENSNTPPAPRPRPSDKGPGDPKKGQFRGLDDAFGRASEDPEVEASLNDLGRQPRV